MITLGFISDIEVSILRHPLFLPSLQTVSKLSQKIFFPMCKIDIYPDFSKLGSLVHMVTFSHHESADLEASGLVSLNVLRNVVAKACKNVPLFKYILPPRPQKSMPWPFFFFKF